MGPATRTRWGAALVLLAPVVLFAAFFYHPLIVNIGDQDAVAEALHADTTRWAVAHLATGAGSALLAVAFLAIGPFLREQGDDGAGTWALPFVVAGSTLFAMLPGMEMGLLAGAETGADTAAIQAEMNRWFLPTLVASSVLFLVGAIGFARAIVKCPAFAPATAWTAAAALVLAAAVRFVPSGVQFYVGGVLGLVALWPLGIVMWRHAGTPRATSRADLGGEGASQA